MEILVGAIANSIGRGDILLSEFDGIEHRKFFHQFKYPSGDIQ